MSRDFPEGPVLWVQMPLDVTLLAELAGAVDKVARRHGYEGRIGLTETTSVGRMSPLTFHRIGEPDEVVTVELPPE